MEKMSFEAYRKHCITYKIEEDLINAFNRKFKEKLIIEQDEIKVLPVFVAGNLATILNPVVFLSLNPKLDDNTIKDIQKNGKTPKQWFDSRISYFQSYAKDSEIHSIFKNLLKLVTPPVNGNWGEINKKELIAKNFVNFDWCHYYSDSFPTINFNTINDQKITKLFKKFDNMLHLGLSVINPQIIIIHGKTFTSWVEKYTDINLENPNITYERIFDKNAKILKESYFVEGKLVEKDKRNIENNSTYNNHKYSLWIGEFKNSENVYPVVFINRFVNNLVGGNKCFQIFGDYIRKKINLELV